MPAGRFHEHPQYRAEAMTLRDRVSEKGGLTEADWQKIHELWDQSWRSLWHAVNDSASSSRG